MIEVSKFRVYLRVLETWAYTLVGLLGLFVVTFVCFYFSKKFISPRAFLIIWGLAGLGTCILFLASKHLVIWSLCLEKADPEKYPDLYEVTNEICKQFWFTKNIPLYIWHDRSLNACAFGPGFGFAAIAITNNLYKELNRDELKSVVAHEIAHIRCKDVGLLNLIISMHFGISLLSKWLILVGLRFFPALILGYALKFVEKIIFPIGISAIQKEREFTADTLAAKYCKTAKHLISALKKICKDQAKRVSDFGFDELFFSHPLILDRIENLESLS